MQNNDSQIFQIHPHPHIDGAFFFLVLDCLYTIKLDKSNRYDSRPLLSNGGNNYEVIITKHGDFNGEQPPKDFSISATIVYILNMLLATKSEDSVFYYVCDNNDGNGKKRSRLFGVWYVSVQRSIPNLEKHNFIVPGFDGDEYFISLLIFSNHPNKKEFIESFGNSLEDYNKNDI